MPTCCLLDAGEIGYAQPNSSLRIPLEEMLAYKKRRSRKRRELLSEMTSDAAGSRRSAAS